MSERTLSQTLELVAEVSCPHCEQPVNVPVPNRDVELNVRPYVAAFGDHRVVNCPADHRFWVYFC
ncbi:hypothetical protein [Haladaptatus sp. DYSN1]|uniref:hypothetical protein n=1 Tax=unclassified Haladaptatus TaxID=2622732 RepID=UPI002406C3B2|nr:hypothetical protein [Haladaptatus sp. DYSN1]